LNLHLLEEELRESSILSLKAVQYLQVLDGESRRLSAILDNFMKFAKPGVLHLHPVDVKSVVAHVASLMQYEAEERKISLETTVPESLCPVLGDETQISQVLVNIIVNAFQAMPEGGFCRISAIGQESAATEWVEISVHDTGIGMKGEELTRLFEPFYTTKSNGTGLGLAIAYRIIADHGGEIRINSESGKGTSVVIKLPAAAHKHRMAMVGL
jgi:signal transduction histidine kinase